MPRATLVIVGGFALFFVVAFLYSMPVFFEPLPEGATQSYLEERVKARLEGKVPWFLGVSLIAAAAIGARTARR
jgi:hypothetical protein